VTWKYTTLTNDLADALAELLAPTFHWGAERLETWATDLQSLQEGKVRELVLDSPPGNLFRLKLDPPVVLYRPFTTSCLETNEQLAAELTAAVVDIFTTLKC